MNVYDFDGTIYCGDSTVDFYLYCLRRCPTVALRAPQQGWSILRHTTGRISTAKMKEEFFCFLRDLEKPEALAEAFWNSRQAGIREWYLEQKQETDLVVSASPEFLLQPICRRLGVRPPIATRMDPASGRIEGQNCKGAEKVRRFLERYPEEPVDRFYSDSLTDAPLAKLAKAAFFVRGDTITRWEVTSP